MNEDTIKARNESGIHIRDQGRGQDGIFPSNNHNSDRNNNKNTNISINTPHSTSESSSDWPVDAAAYTILGKVGRGAFATVYKATTAGIVTNANVNTNSNANSNSTDNTENAASTAAGSGPTSTSTSRYCAIKIINLEHVDTNFVDIRLEVQTMRLSQNENILACYTSFIHHTNLWLVMQLMEKGSSLHCLQKARIHYNPLNHDLNGAGIGITSAASESINMNMPGSTDLEKHITYILHETILGLQYIHSHGQIHRDIKASNLLLNSTATLRIADFGVSGWLISAGSQRENTRTFVGTPCWMAPEVMEQIHGYDTKADIWSLGITALELAKGYAPYAKFPPMKVLLMTIQEDPPGFGTYRDQDGDDGLGLGIGIGGGVGRYIGQVSNEERNLDWSKSFQSMVTWCLQKDPTKRPNCEELLNHEHFKSFKEDGQRMVYKAELKKEICDWISNVGHEAEKSANGNLNEPMPMGRNNSDLPVCVVSAMEENRPSGTTWIFSDGSQVVASGSGLSTAVTGESGDQDFFDHFENTTQGEDFKHPSTIAEEVQQQHQQQQAEEVQQQQQQQQKEDDDDLNAFMDNFEMQTGGENFRSSN
mmetsp:Transcript_16544/g.24755  ORF Transcript_16544/g.24755 Transcript_16544/m.24755 type:complete len:593 (-) Transcript_16544:114-1892(-)